MKQNSPHHPIRIGPAGWNYADWAGVVYPSRIPKGFDQLQWMARFFNLIELNVSFYRTPSPSTAESWVDRLKDFPDFSFSAKIHQDWTHREGPPPAGALAHFERFLEPLVDARRLDLLLAQFPWSFRPGAAALERLLRLAGEFGHRPHLPLVLELRHGDWKEPEAVELLQRLELPVAYVDQPELGSSLQLGDGRGPLHYLRLHGRNRQDWARPGAGRDARYNYLYGPVELASIGHRIRELAASGPVHVVTNNHFRGKAVVNALELKELLELPAEEMPAWLLEEYPRLGDLKARPIREAGSQTDLF